MKESVIENAILQYLNIQPDTFAVKLKDQTANFEGQNKRAAPYMFRGVPDIVCYRQSGLVLWIEVKTEAGKLSKYQKSYKQKIEALGHVYFTVRSLQEMKDILSNH